MRVPLIYVLTFMYLFGFSGMAAAQSTIEEEFAVMKVQFEAMKQKMAQMEQQIADQQKQLAAKEEASVPAAQNRPLSAKWTPEIGVIADTLFALNSSRAVEEGMDQFSIRELELVLGSNVDPFSRLDATIAFSTSEEEPVALEEAYLTRFGLPLDTTARIGKFKPKVGKALGVHRDSLDTVDEPLVIQRYFSEEGLSKTGVDISKILNLPLPVTQQLTLGVLNGGNVEEDEGIFGGPGRRPILYGHLKNYIDITPNTGFELGGSYMTGSRDDDPSFEVRAIGADATLIHHFNATQNMKIQAEAFNVDRKGSFVDVEEDDGLGGTIVTRHNLDGNIWGAYGLVDFRVHPSWALGGRYDFVQPIATELPVEGARNDDRAYSGYLTFHQSEFARWRLQFTHTDFATGKDDNAVYLQGTFAIGDHKHKIQ